MDYFFHGVYKKWITEFLGMPTELHIVSKIIYFTGQYLPFLVYMIDLLCMGGLR